MVLQATRGMPQVWGTISYSSMPAPLTNLTNASPREAPNPDLRWEKIRTINTGLDFAL